MGGGPLARRADGDDNGEISSAEWQALVSGLDADDDGVLETTDFDALFAELEADGSGTIEADELPRPRFRHSG